MFSRQAGGRQEHTLASPLLGTGITVANIEQLFLTVEAAKDPDPDGSLMRLMQERQQQLLKEGKPVASTEEARIEVERTFAEFRRTRLPTYRQLGIV
jgi:hypothetical protein